MQRTYAFVDLAGLSALTEGHGDTAAADLVERFRELVDQTLAGEAKRVRMIGDRSFSEHSSRARPSGCSPGPWVGLSPSSSF